VEALKGRASGLEQLYISMGHPNEEGTITYFDETFESSGTRRLFLLSGQFIQAWEKGSLLLVDELDASLHPLAAMNLVWKLGQPSWSDSIAQLIFTSHNPALLRADMLHRDQIWFTERDNRQSVRLTSLADFEKRTDTAREDRYLAGRYGGIPVIRWTLGDPAPLDSLLTNGDEGRG
jgi:AAA15 family ATPase/GTPase